MKNVANQFREAADRVWEMAKEYEERGEWEVAQTLKELTQQLHDLARHSYNGENPDA